MKSASVTRPGAIETGLFIAVSIAVALIGFSGALLELVRRWGAQEEYSHGYLIPIIAGWLLWTRRAALLESIGRPSWLGALLVLVAMAMHIVGELSALYILSQTGFIVAVMGIVLAAGGYSLLKVSFIPIVFLVFAIPLPYFIDSVLSWRLQLVSSELGVFIIRAFQVPVYLEGNVIDLGNYKLQVVEACSGLRYLYPFLSLGFLAAYLFQAPLWQRVLVFLSTIPITIFMNSLRIGIVGVLVDVRGPQDADGWLHFFEGWIIFIACAGLLVAEMYLLTRLQSGKGFFDVFYPPKVTAKPALGQGAQSLSRAPLASCFFVLFATGLAVFFVSGRQEIQPERARFAAFPSQVGEWRGLSTSMEPQIEHALGLSDYILSDYRRRDGRHVNLYVAYYASQRKGSSPHSPSVCIPGNGWRITQFDRTSYSNDDLKVSLPLNRVVIQRDSQKQIVYYWFEQRGRKIANEYWSKWYLLTDAIFRNRTDGALVRLTTPVYPGELERDADSRLQAFASEVVPKLTGYLPSQTLKIKPAAAKPNAKHS